MLVRHFGVTGERATLLTSRDRRIPVYRTVLQIRIWNGRKFDPPGIQAIWHPGADLFTISEQLADDMGIEWSAATESLGSAGTAGSVAGVLVPLVIRLDPIRDLAFRVECQVLLGTDFPRPLLGNQFIRRNFNVQTLGERRTFFRLREHAPDVVPVAQLRTA